MGVLGRIADAITANGFKTRAFSIRRESKVQENVPGMSPPPDFIGTDFVQAFNEDIGIGDGFGRVVQNLTESRSSVFGDIWSSSMRRGINSTGLLRKALNDKPLLADSSKYWTTNSLLEKQLKQVAKLLAGRDVLGTDRNTFSVSQLGFDAHNSIQKRFSEPLQVVDTALDSFVAEMKAQGIWDDVVVVVASEFGRSLRSNGRGTGTCD